MNAGQIETVSVTLPSVTAGKILIITWTIAMRLKSWLAAGHPLDTSQLIAASSMQSSYDVPQRAGGPTFSVKCKSYIHTKCTVVPNWTYSEASQISTKNNHLPNVSVARETYTENHEAMVVLLKIQPIQIKLRMIFQRVWKLRPFFRFENSQYF